MPFPLRIVYTPERYEYWETGPTVYHSCSRRLWSLTINRCHYKCEWSAKVQPSEGWDHICARYKEGNFFRSIPGINQKENFLHRPFIWKVILKSWVPRKCFLPKYSEATSWFTQLAWYQGRYRIRYNRPFQAQLCLVANPLSATRDADSFMQTSIVLAVVYIVLFHLSIFFSFSVNHRSCQREEL